MKMKKVLAGILSATMVATMIAASMAFSGVSAAEDTGNGLVASYDFTKGQTDVWSDATKGEGTAVTVDDNGVTTIYSATDPQSYSIENPLQNKVTDGFTVVVETGRHGYNNPNTTLFSFAHSQNPYWVLDSDTYTGAGAFSVMSDYTSMHLNPWEGNTNGYWDYGLEGFSEDTGTRFVLTGNADGGIALYKDGEVVVSFANTADILAAATGQGGVDYMRTVAYWVNTMEYFNLGTGTYWPSEAKNYTYVAFYNTEMTADEVEAEYIASQLDLEVVGMQKGTLGDDSDTTAIRFVANMDGAMTNQYNNGTIVNVGWAWEANTAFSGNYTPVAVSTVTNDSNLLVDTDDLAYTMVFASSDENDYYSIVPYVDIQVNGQTYTFCYNGRGASYQSSSSDMVYAPVNFVGAGA